MALRANNGLTIGYLVKTFPKVTETFILNEILALERQGLRLEVYSTERLPDAHVP